VLRNARQLLASTDYNGLFDVPLTPACREAVKDMINKAKEIFVEWWENQ